MSEPFNAGDAVWVVVGTIDDGYSLNAAKIVGKHPSGPNAWVVEYLHDSHREYEAEREMFHSEADAWREILWRFKGPFQQMKEWIDDAEAHIARLEGKR